MNTRVAAIGLVCLLAGCTVPAPRVLSAPTNADDAPAKNLVNPARAAPLPAPAPQYAPGEMFMRTHGEFMLGKEPWRPDLRGSFLGLQNSEVKGEPGSFDLLYGKVDLEGRLYLADPNGFLKGGIQYHERRYDFEGTGPATADETLHRASVSVGGGYFLDGDTGDVLLEASFNPGLYSDFDGTMNSGDWQFYADGLLTFRLDRGVFLKVGAEYSALFRNTDVFPLLGIAWRINNTWRIDILLPKDIRVTCSFNPQSSLSAGIDLEGDRYRTRAPVDSANPKLEREVYVQEMKLYLAGEHRFNKHFSVHARGGMTILGDYDWQSGDPAAEYDGTLDPDLFWEVGLGWTF